MSFHFPEQRPDEVVLMLLRKHPIVYVKIISVFLITILLPLLGFLWLWFGGYPFASHYQGGLIVGIFSSVYLLYGLLFSCVAWINEEFDVFIISNERLIDITQVTLLRRTVATTPLEQIQDVTSDVTDLVPTLLDYGDLEVQTAAGHASTFFMDHVPHADKAARQILNWADQKRATGYVSSLENPPPSADYHGHEEW